MSLKKLAHGFKSNGASENRTRTVRVESRAQIQYTTGPRQIGNIDFNDNIDWAYIYIYISIGLPHLHG